MDYQTQWIYSAIFTHNLGPSCIAGYKCLWFFLFGWCNDVDIGNGIHDYEGVLFGTGMKDGVVGQDGVAGVALNTKGHCGFRHKHGMIRVSNQNTNKFLK